MARLNPNPVSLMSAILNDPDNFPEAHRSLPSIATKLAVDEVKARSTDTSLFKTFKSLLDERDFCLLLDALAKPTLAKTVKHMDAHNPGIRGAEADWLRKRLIALLDGEPAYIKAARPTKGASSRKVTKPAVGKAAVAKREINPTKAKNSKAKWDGKNRDEEI